MGNPLPERITVNDRQYMDGYAKFYMFEAFKGQRLTTVAMEDRTTNPGSFIRSRLFNEQSQEIGAGDTRIEFIAPYTGIYYYIVSSFNNQEGGYLLKVFDRNQTENLNYVKYEDGSEELLDYNSKKVIHGEKNVALEVQFVNPVELIDNQVRFYLTSSEFEGDTGLVSAALTIYAKDEKFCEFLACGSPFTLLEGAQYKGCGSQSEKQDSQYEIASKFTKISQSKILIQKANGELFPSRHRIVLSSNNPKARVGVSVWLYESKYILADSYPQHLINKCQELNSLQCSPDCNDNYYEDAFFDHKVNTENFVPSYRLTDEDKNASFARYSISLCQDCKKQFFTKEDENWKQVSCEEMFRTVLNRNCDCGGCVSSFQNTIKYRTP